MVLIILSALTYLQNFIDNYNKIREYKVGVIHSADLKHCEALFKKHHLKYVLIKQQYTQGNITATWRLTGKNTHHEELIKDLVDDSTIIAYQF